MPDRLMQMAQVILGLYGDVWAIEETRFVAYLRAAEMADEDLIIVEHKAPYRLFGLDSNRVEEFCEISALKEKASSPGSYVAVLPLEGPITHKGNGWFGGASLHHWIQDLKEMGSMENVGAIVVDTDSPGGSVAGLLEAAEAVRQVKQAKPVSFISNTWMASAAYWLGSQGSDVYVTPSGEVGSVGVYSLHLDLSGMLEKAGIVPTFVHAGEHKVEGNPLQPLSESAKQEMQASVDYYYDRFVKEVAVGRRVSQAKVKADFGGGRMFRPEAAVEIGMADGIMKMEDLLMQHATRIKNRQRRAADMKDKREEVEYLYETTLWEAGQPVAPYPNERSCRLRQPSEFQPDSFRRMTRKHNGKEYGVIVGRPKGKTTMAEQAYRYKKDTWSADEARSHCKDHGGSFEDASGN